VVKTGSSASSPPILASSSLAELSLSLASIFTLPTELLSILLSCPRLPHMPPAPSDVLGAFMLGESSIMMELMLPFLCLCGCEPGIIIAFCVITGLESGELCSASVE
jgi:hypothetical protein